MRSAAFAACFFVCVACSPDTRARVTARVNAADFWPDAPAPSRDGGARVLAWKLDHLRAYEIEDDQRLALTIGNHVSTTGERKIAMELRFQAGAGPESRDVYIRRADVSESIEGFTRAEMKGGYSGIRRAVHVGHDGISIDRGYGPKPYQPGDEVPFSIPNIGDRASTLVVDNDGALVEDAAREFKGVFARPLLRAIALVLPRDAIAPGATWTRHVSHDLPDGSEPFGATATYEYLGDSACPSSAERTCAQIRYTIVAEGTARHGVTVTGATAGKVFFDIDHGIVAEERLVFDLEIIAGPKGSMELRGMSRLRALEVAD
jgi:hypothetical protein